MRYLYIKNRSTKTNIIFVFCIFLFILSGRIYADNNTVDIDSTKNAIEEWVETERIISKEKHDLAIAKEMLNERIALIQSEIDSLQGKIRDANESIAEADKKRVDLIDENEKLKEVSSSLGKLLSSLESRTKKLIVKLPDPIRERIKPLSQRLPENPEENKLSVSQRFQNVVGILNEVDKFNRDISVFSEVRTLPDGTSSEVTALYLGIGQSYYTSANNSVAGIGNYTDEGWEWKQLNETAMQVSQAIAILKNEQVASFVQLPIEIK